MKTCRFFSFSFFKVQLDLANHTKVSLQPCIFLFPVIIPLFCLSDKKIEKIWFWSRILILVPVSFNLGSLMQISEPKPVFNVIFDFSFIILLICNSIINLYFTYFQFWSANLRPVRVLCNFYGPSLQILTEFVHYFRPPIQNPKSKILDNFKYRNYM